MRFLLTFTATFVVTGAAALAQESKKPAYPSTKTDNVVDVLHGVKIVDPYRWLEDGDSDATKAWVEEQNKFTQTLLGKVSARDKIRERLSSLLEIGSLGTPTPRKGHYFYTKREGTQNQPVLYVRDGAGGKDRVLLDINELSKEGTVALDWYFPSRDGKLLAYGLSKDGSEFSTLRIRNVDTGKDLPETIERTRACSIACSTSLPSPVRSVRRAGKGDSGADSACGDLLVPNRCSSASSTGPHTEEPNQASRARGKRAFTSIIRPSGSSRPMSW